MPITQTTPSWFTAIPSAPTIAESRQFRSILRDLLVHPYLTSMYSRLWNHLCTHLNSMLPIILSIPRHL